MPNTPIVYACAKYVYGLGISKTDDKIITMASGQASNSTRVNDIILDNSVNIDGRVVGANGVDFAPLISNRLYAVYIIGDSTDYNKPAGLLSLNPLLPNVPGDYDMYRRIGWVLTDSSANISQFWQYGNGNNRSYYYDIPVNVLTTGNSNVFADVDLSAAVPPILTQVTFQMTYLASFGISKVQFLPFGSTQTNGIINVNVGIATIIEQPITIPAGLDNGIPKIQYKVSQVSDQLTLSVSGFLDVID